jgi:uncharacterized repeat protein (TIGR01451 family)
MVISGFTRSVQVIRAFSVCAGLLLLVPQIGWAAGTPSGTTISNSATLTYVIGAGPVITANSNAVSFLVDEKINLSVLGGATTNVVPGATAQATAFTVTNLSNSPLDFNLAVTSVIAGDNFDPTACSAFVENGATAGYQPAQDTATFIDELAANANVTVYAVCDIPASVVTANTALVGLTATARGTFTGPNGTYVATGGSVGAIINQTAVADTAGSVDIVFADGAGTEDPARDAAYSAHNTYSVTVPVVMSLTKTVTSVVDPNGTGVLMPNAVMTYQIVADLTGSGTVTNLVITDPLPPETTYVTGSITVACNSGTYTGGGACSGITIPKPATSKSDTNTDSDYADFTANTVTVTLGNVAAPANIVITFKATIN